MSINSFTTSLFLLLFTNLCFGQSQNDIAFFHSEITVETATLNNRAQQVNAISPDKNELQVLGFVIYQVYHNLISSQDGSVCNFHPTCSAYCRHAIRKNGLIHGSIQSLDRVMRCNGLSPEKYQIDFQKRKLIDHVE